MNTIMIEFIKKLVDRTVHLIEETIERVNVHLLQQKQIIILV